MSLGGALSFNGFDFNPRGTANAAQPPSVDSDTFSGEETPQGTDATRKSLLEDLESSDEECADDGVDTQPSPGEVHAPAIDLPSAERESTFAQRLHGKLGSELWRTLPSEILVRNPNPSTL